MLPMQRYFGTLKRSPLSGLSSLIYLDTSTMPWALQRNSFAQYTENWILLTVANESSLLPSEILYRYLILLYRHC